MAKRSKQRLPPRSSGEPSTSATSLPSSQDGLKSAPIRSPEVTRTNGSADTVPISSSHDLVGDIIAKSAVAPAVDRLLRKASRKRPLSKNPSASSSRRDSAGPQPRRGSKNAAGSCGQSSGAPKWQPAERRRAASSAVAPVRSHKASLAKERAAAAHTPLVLAPGSGSTSAGGSQPPVRPPEKPRACSSGPAVADGLRQEVSYQAAAVWTVPTNGAMPLQGIVAPEPAYPAAPLYQGVPGQVVPRVPSTLEPVIQDEEMEDLSEAIDENLQNQVPLAADHKGIFVITDTNIFLHNLDLVKRLTALDAGPPDVKVCLPWVALQELDHIKNRKRGPSTPKAVAAIAYINRALVSKNPKFRGQTIDEARSKDDVVPTGFNNNDDHFIHCCLVVGNTGNRVVLLSNDVNLRNKALINNIPSLSAAEAEAVLDRDWGRSTQAQPGCSTATEPATACLPSATPVPGASAVVAEVRTILRESLNLVLGQELPSAFGKVWLKVVAFKPPWTEITAVQCILRHWISLTGMAFEPPTKKVMEELLPLLRKQHLGLSCPTTVVSLALALCSRLQVHYYTLSDAVDRLKKLQKSLQCRQHDV